MVNPELQPTQRHSTDGEQSHLLCFGTFELNLHTRELRKAGVRIRLQEQPFKVLVMLLERRGELVSRDELKQQLWGEAEFGDFDQAINVAVKKLRVALGDYAENPRFVETLPRRGYRFIAPIRSGNDLGDAESTILAQPIAPDIRPYEKQWKSWAAGIGFLLIALIVIISLAVHRTRTRPFGVTATNEFHLVPLTASLGYEMDPQFSPDGKEIAYAWISGKNELPDIYVKLLGDGAPVRLLPQQSGVGHVVPAWSPDGRYLACVRFERLPDLPPDANKSLTEQMKERMASRRAASIYLVPAIGGEEKKLFDVGEVSDLRWSADGKWLLAAERSTHTEPMSLYRTSLDGRERVRLTFPPANYEGDTEPAFSPDGKLIAFSRNFSSGAFDVFVMDASGGEPRRLTNDGEHISGIAFSQNGQDIIFSSARGGGERRGLWRVPVVGGAPRQLPFGTDNAGAPAVSPTGNHLAFVQTTYSDKIWAYDIPAPGQAATQGRVAIASRQLQVAPQFSPDGRRVAFASTRSGSWEIWVSSPDGSNSIQLTRFGGRQTGSPHWSADGKQIAFDARPDKHSEIYMIDAEGGAPRRLTRTGEKDAVVPTWSHDGRWIYYASNAGGNWDLWKAPLEGSSKPVQVTTQGGFAPFESGDGKTLYYAKWNEAGIYSMPTSGGPETLVTGELLPGLWRYWSLGEKGIHLLRPARKPNSTDIIPMLSFLSFQTGKIVDLRLLDGPPNPGPGMAVSPDGKLLLCTQPDEGGSEIMIVENFR